MHYFRTYSVIWLSFSEELVGELVSKWTWRHNDNRQTDQSQRTLPRESKRLLPRRKQVLVFSQPPLLTILSTQICLYALLMVLNLHEIGLCLNKCLEVDMHIQIKV